jgi:ethanolamine utilization protein EutQ (cupin superfamily)
MYYRNFLVVCESDMCSEMKIILSGDFTISSEETGQKVSAKPGDVFNFPKGAKIHFETVNGGLAFYVGQVCTFSLMSLSS